MKTRRAFLSMWYPGNISSRLSNNSEASASELLDNLEEMLLRYHMVTMNTSVFQYDDNEHTSVSIW